MSSVEMDGCRTCLAWVRSTSLCQDTKRHNYDHSKIKQASLTVGANCDLTHSMSFQIDSKSHTHFTPTVQPQTHANILINLQ
jgi:hypothetical protein